MSAAPLRVGRGKMSRERDWIRMKPQPVVERLARLDGRSHTKVVDQKSGKVARVMEGEPKQLAHVAHKKPCRAGLRDIAKRAKIPRFGGPSPD